MIEFSDKVRVINRHREPNADGVYVGRPSKYGNPFEIGRDGTRERVILKYAAHLMENPQLVEDARTELRGKNLICWCAPKSCHADLLLSIANWLPE